MVRQPVVLIVEDETVVGEMLMAYLKTLGYTPVFVQNSTRATRVLSKTHVDAVLLDLRLGPEDGFDVLKKIKSNHPSLPVIILTGLGYDDQTMDTALTLGAEGFLSKGIDVSEIRVAIDRILAAHTDCDPRKN